MTLIFSSNPCMYKFSKRFQGDYFGIQISVTKVKELVVTLKTANRQTEDNFDNEGSHSWVYRDQMACSLGLSTPYTYSTFRSTSQDHWHEELSCTNSDAHLKRTTRWQWVGLTSSMPFSTIISHIKTCFCTENWVTFSENGDHYHCLPIMRYCSILYQYNLLSSLGSVKQDLEIFRMPFPPSNNSPSKGGISLSLLNIAWVMSCLTLLSCQMFFLYLFEVATATVAFLALLVPGSSSCLQPHSLLVSSREFLGCCHEKHDHLLVNILFDNISQLLCADLTKFKNAKKLP